MQCYPQPLYVLVRTILEKRLYADFQTVTPETLPGLLDRAKAAAWRCFGCAEYLTGEEFRSGTGLCEECRRKRQWERN